MSEQKPITTSGDPEAAEMLEVAEDDGEKLVKKTTHEVETGDMTSPMTE